MCWSLRRGLRLVTRHDSPRRHNRKSNLKLNLALQFKIRRHTFPWLIQPLDESVPGVVGAPTLTLTPPCYIPAQVYNTEIYVILYEH